MVSTASPTIAIVEDQQAIAELLVEVLREAGYTPLWSPSITEAAAFVREHAAAVVLLDVMMPELSGWEILEQLRADPATQETPVIIISAVYDRHGLHATPAGGPVRFAAKPFDIASLIETIRSLIE
jgi:twitching motility two-component system response regulator PilH